MRNKVVTSNTLEVPPCEVLNSMKATSQTYARKKLADQAMSRKKLADQAMFSDNEFEGNDQVASIEISTK